MNRAKLTRLIDGRRHVGGWRRKQRGDGCRHGNRRGCRDLVRHRRDGRGRNSVLPAGAVVRVIVGRARCRIRRSIRATTGRRRDGNMRRCRGHGSTGAGGDLQQHRDRKQRSEENLNETRHSSPEDRPATNRRRRSIAWRYPRSPFDRSDDRCRSSMQKRGVEPLHLAVRDPKSRASASSATSAREELETSSATGSNAQQLAAAFRRGRRRSRDAVAVRARYPRRQSCRRLPSWGRTRRRWQRIR